MKLQKPFTGNYYAGQRFGMNLNDFYRADGLKGHTGIDFPMPNGTPVVSPFNGTIIFVSTDIAKGEGVTILSDDLFDYNGQPCKLSCLLWHLKDQSIQVKVGDKVTTGQALGLSNNTGRSTGPHLHLSVCPLAPDGSRRELAFNNGYGSCIDPTQYLDFPLSVIPMVEFSHTWHLPGQKVKEFQKAHGLKDDGIVGPKTQAEIEKLI